MKKLLILLILVGGISSSLHAEVNTKIISVKGHGTSYSEAVQNSLIEALKQIEGVSINSHQEYSKLIQEHAFSKNEQSSSHEIEVNKNVQGVVSEATQGLISGYSVIDSKDNGDGEWLVEVEVHVSEYETPGISPNSRRRLAVIPFRTTCDSYTFIESKVPSTEASRQFSQKLVNELTQSRRFVVLDREYMDEFLKEKGLVLSGDTSLEEQMKIGEVLGVDYLLVGTITDTNTKRKFSTVKALGETVSQDSASFIGDYRIIVMATRQVKWADSVNLFLSNKDLKKLVPSMETEEIKQAVFSEAAINIVHRALENIYPIKVAQLLANGELILNQGGTTLTDGQLLDVYVSGEKIIDPYTGESLGFSETWTAKIKVIRVIAKMSYAQVVQGELNNIQIGSICRRVVAESPKKRQKDTQRTKPKW